MNVNLTGLKDAFAEALHRHEPTLLFELFDGPGRFVFMVFLPTDSKGKVKLDKLELFLFLGRTQRMLAFPLYGSFLRKGDFLIYLKQAEVEAIRFELGITGAAGGTPFDVQAFLARLNAQIPTSIPLRDKIDLMQTHRHVIQEHCGKYVDQATKIYLIGPKRLPATSRPREETLRKLSMLSEDAAMIARLIERLKERNVTTAWTDDPNASSKRSFADLWASVFG